MQVLDERLVLAHIEAVIEVGQPLEEPVLFLVCHATGHGNGASGPGPLPTLELAEFAVGLLLGILANTTGDQDRQVSVVQVGDGTEAGGSESLLKVVGIRLVHLAATYPEVEALS